MFHSFNTHFDCHIQLELKQHDIFVQKCYEVYRGFIQLSQDKESTLDEETLNSNTRFSNLKTKNEDMLCEHLVTLPKNLELLSLNHMRRVSIVYLDEGCPLTVQMLERVAVELGNEWKDLGRVLGLSPVVIHLIENNAIQTNRADSEKKLDMLLNWNKTQKRSANKLETLAAALKQVNRGELEELLLHFDDLNLNSDFFDSKTTF